MIKPTMARMFKATARAVIEALSHACGRKMRMMRMPTPNFGRAILRKDQASIKITQKPAVETESIGLAVEMCLVEVSAFWKTAALIMLSICWRKQSAPWPVGCGTVLEA